jgi:hypothetical protein
MSDELRKVESQGLPRVKVLRKKDIEVLIAVAVREAIEGHGIEAKLLESSVLARFDELTGHANRAELAFCKAEARNAEAESRKAVAEAQAAQAKAQSVLKGCRERVAKLERELRELRKER